MDAANFSFRGRLEASTDIQGLKKVYSRKPNLTIRGERHISPRVFPVLEHPTNISPLCSNKRLLTNEHIKSLEQPKVKPTVGD